MSDPVKLGKYFVFPFFGPTNFVLGYSHGTADIPDHGVLAHRKCCVSAHPAGCGFSCPKLGNLDHAGQRGIRR